MKWFRSSRRETKRNSDGKPAERTLWRSDQLENPGSYASDTPVKDDTTPNLVSSETSNGLHMPVIDCDYEIEAVPSSTPGHFHLYISVEITWDQYKALLDGFFLAGLIEKGWYDNAVRDKRTYVRRKGIFKPYDDIKKRLLETGQLFPDEDPLETAVWEQQKEKEYPLF